MTPDEAKALRAPFDEAVIGQLPRTICRECSASPSGVCDKHEKRRCDGTVPNLPRGCNNYMTVAHIHLDYVGHAGVTDRLLQIDPNWRWDPVATDPNTNAPLKSDGGLWITLTVCGTTRYGWGDGKNTKEMIGDAIRNAAMRFGVALDLWAKEDLHAAPPVNPADPAAIVALAERLDALEPDTLRREAKIAFKQRFGLPDDLTSTQLYAASDLVTEYEQRMQPEADPATSAEAAVSEPGDAPSPEPDADAPSAPEQPERPDVKALAHDLGVPESVALALARDEAKRRGIKKPVMLTEIDPELDLWLVQALGEHHAQAGSEPAEAADA
jgi:hypothetical protein